MAIKRVMIGGQLVEMDDQTGELVVKDFGVMGTGLPIPLHLADPGNDNYSAALNPNPITRACARIRIIVGNSGCVISLDGGNTASITLPADYADDLAVAIPASCDIRVKRFTAGTPITDLIVEVR